MKTVKHKELFGMEVCADWTGNGARVVLAKKGSAFWCLWGEEGREISELAPVACTTLGGRNRKMRSSFKQFREMINTTQRVTIKST